MPSSVDTIPAASVVRAPYSILDSTSLPSWSVPSRWCGESGGASTRPKFVAFGSYGAASGPNTATSTTMSEPTAPTIASALNRGRILAARTIRAAARALSGRRNARPGDPRGHEVPPAVTRSRGLMSV